MIIDTSALVAICLREPGYEAFFDAITRADAAFISAASLTETSMVLLGRTGNPFVFSELDRLLEENDVVIEPVTVEDAKAARDAFRVYGKGQPHPARLNFGDCFTYALAWRLWQPILCKGNDFAQTDALIVPLP